MELFRWKQKSFVCLKCHALLGLPVPPFYLRIEQGLLPKPVSLGGKAVGWPASEISQINAARIAGKSNEEIKNLVDELENQRVKERNPS